MNQYRTGFLGNIPPITLNIIIITFICWLAQLLLDPHGIDVTQFFGLHYFSSDKFYPHQLITYIFMHATYGPGGHVTFQHILFNMFPVFMFGRILETVWGSKRFIFFYIATGIGAALAQELTWMYDLRDIVFAPEISYINIGNEVLSRTDFFDMFITVGASGSVFGILIAFGMLFPNTELIMLPIPIPVKAKYFVILYGILELFQGIANTAGDGVAHFAHIGGLLFGALIVLYWKKQNKKHGRFF